MSIYETNTAEMLQAHGLSRTPGRLALLKVLAAATRPLSLEELQDLLSKQLGIANLYRALEAFKERGIVIRFDFGNGRAYYELAHEKSHHHHAVCEKCGTVTDIPAQDSSQLTSTALKHAKGFAAINRHSLEFYGLCKTCA